MWSYDKWNDIVDSDDENDSNINEEKFSPDGNQMTQTNEFSNALTRHYLAMQENMKKNKPCQNDKMPILDHNHRKKVLMKHEATLKNQKSGSGLNQLQTNSDPLSCQHLCIKPMNKLKEITISELKVNQINFNTKLIVSVINQPLQICAIIVTVQDKDNNVLSFSLYNFAALSRTVDELNRLLPIGTKLIIKEPYCKKATDATYTLRLDNPHTNLIVILSNDPKYMKIKERNPEVLKNCGNDNFKKGIFAKAIKYYSEGIRNCKDHEEIKSKLLSNRCLCHIKINKYNEAMIDAKHAIELGGSSFKLQYRLATALTGLREHGQSIKILNNIDTTNIKSISAKKDIKKLKTKVEKRLKESTCDTKYSNPEHFRQMQYVDIEDCYSNKIKIKYINGIKGRGVVATENIAKNEIILVEKCITFGDVNKNRITCLTDLRLKEWFSDSTINLIQNIVNIYTNGKLSDKYKISLLYDRGKYDKTTIIPKMDIFRTDLLPGNVDPLQIPILDIDQIRKIATINAFAMPTNKKSQKEFDNLWNKSKSEQKRFQKWLTGSALFVVSSFFNHSNKPNILNYPILGKMCMLSIRNIKKGEELCIAYSDKQNVGHWLDKNIAQ